MSFLKRSPLNRDSMVSFRLKEWNNVDEEMLTIKDTDLGENGLHLQIPGIWMATLYLEVFGIQESYILLLSLMIRLG